METGKGVTNRIGALEVKLKLIKGELKATLASVRDYLTSFKLPPPGDAEFLRYIDSEDEQKIIMSGAVSHGQDKITVETVPSSYVASNQAPQAPPPVPSR